MPCKVVLFYNQANRGFSETWYSPATTPGAIDPTQPDWVAFLSAAISFRAKPSVLFAMRISTVAPPLNSTLYRFNNKYETGSGDWGGSATPDMVSTDAVVTFMASNQKKKNMFIRGLVDSDTVRDPTGADVPSATLQKALTNYLNKAFNLSLSIRYQTDPTTSANVFNQILDIAPDPQNSAWSLITCKNPVTFVAGATPPQYVRFYGRQLDSTPGFPRIAQVQAVAGNTFSIAYLYRANTVTFAPKNMKCILNTYLYIPPTAQTFQMFSERKTGRPFGSLRGRNRSLVRAE